MLSQNQSELVSQKESQPSNIFGLYFCSSCHNMMAPFKANGHMLELKCPTCGISPLDFSRRQHEQCMLYSKQLQVGSKKYRAELDYIFDPTMPSVQVECPECGHNRAIYILTPDEGENKMLAKMICTNARGTTILCGNIWDLEQDFLLQKTKAFLQQ